MNKKEIAIGVYKHPLIQEILKKEIADPSVINRLIVQEILSDKRKKELQAIINQETEEVKELTSKKKGEGFDLVKYLNERFVYIETSYREEVWDYLQESIMQNLMTLKVLQSKERYKLIDLIEERRKNAEKAPPADDGDPDKRSKKEKESGLSEDEILGYISLFAGGLAGISSAIPPGALGPLSPAQKFGESGLGMLSNAADVLETMSLIKQGKYEEAAAKLAANAAEQAAISMIPAGRVAKVMNDVVPDKIKQRLAKEITEETAKLVVGKIAKVGTKLATKEYVKSKKNAKTAMESDPTFLNDVKSTFEKAYGSISDTVKDYFSDRAIKKGVAEVRKNQKYTSLFDLAKDEETKKGLAYFIYYIEQPFSGGRLNEYALEGTSIPEEKFIAAKKWLRSKINEAEYRALVKFVRGETSKEVQEEFKKIFAPQPLVPTKPALEPTTDPDTTTDAFELLNSTSRRSEFFRAYLKLGSPFFKDENTTEEQKNKLTKSLEQFDILEPIYINNSYKEKEEEAKKALQQISFSVFGIDQEKGKVLRNKLFAFIRAGAKGASDSELEVDKEQPPDGTEETNKKEVEAATEDGTDPAKIGKDFDKSNPEIPNLQYEQYMKNLDHFFGTGDSDKPSFMKAWFMSYQVDLLHNKLLSSLNSIISPPSLQGDNERALARNEEEPSEPEVQKEQTEQQDNIEISRKNKISLKRELADQAQLLLDAKKIAKAYRKYGTSKSLDAEFDGSSLEKQLNVILGEVQRHNARLISIIAKVASEYEEQEKVVQEQTKQELTRDQKIDIVEKVFKQLGSQYLNNLKTSLENKETEKAIQAAEQMKEIVKEIIPFFPRTIVHSTSGKIITLDDAIINLEGKIKTYKKVLRDIYMTVEDNEVSPIQLTRISSSIKMICSSIDEQFDVSCLINSKELKSIEDNLPEEPEAISDEREERGRITLPDPSEMGPLEDEEEEIDAFPVLGGGTEEPEKEPEVEDTPVEPEVEEEPEEETEETFKIQETEPWKDLNDEERSAVLSFIKNYNLFISNLEEILSPKDPKSAFQRRRKKNKEKLSKNLKKFMNDVNLYGAGGKERMGKILKTMKSKDRNSFYQLIFKENDIIKELVRILGQNSEEPEEKSSSRLRSRYGYSQSRRGSRFEEQLISKLEPVIEQILRGSDG